MVYRDESPGLEHRETRATRPSLGTGPWSFLDGHLDEKLSEVIIKKSAVPAVGDEPFPSCRQFLDGVGLSCLVEICCLAKRLSGCYVRTSIRLSVFEDQIVYSQP